MRACRRCQGGNDENGGAHCQKNTLSFLPAERHSDHSTEMSPAFSTSPRPCAASLPSTNTDSGACVLYSPMPRQLPCQLLASSLPTPRYSSPAFFSFSIWGTQSVTAARNISCRLRRFSMEAVTVGLLGQREAERAKTVTALTTPNSPSRPIRPGAAADRLSCVCHAGGPVEALRPGPAAVRTAAAWQCQTTVGVSPQQ